MSSLGSSSGVRRLVFAALVVGFAVATGAVAGTVAAEPELDEFEFDADDTLAGGESEYTVETTVTNVSAGEELTFELDIADWTESENGEFVSRSDTGDFDSDDVVGGVVQLTKTASDEEVSPGFNVTLVNPTADDATASLTVADEDENSQTADETVELSRISASFADDPVDSIGPDDETALTVEAGGSPVEHVEISSPGLDGNELESVFGFDGDRSETSVRTDGDRLLVDRPADQDEQPPVADIEATFTHIGAANYEFVIGAQESNEETTIPLEVEEPDIDIEFDEDLYEVPAGDLVTMDINLDGIDEGYFLVGADGTTAEEGVNDFLDIVRFDGGELAINTRLLGTDASTDAVYSTDGEVYSYLHGDENEFDDVEFREDEEGEGDEIASSLEEYREELDMTEQPRPLQPDRYRIVGSADPVVITRDDEIPDLDYPLARSNLLLNQPQPGEVTTHVAPQASANSVEETGNLNELLDELTERETVAKGDRLVFEIEATGIYGNLFNFGDRTFSPFEEGVHPRALGGVVDAHEGVIVNVSQTNSDANTAPTEIDFNEPSDGEAYVITHLEDEAEPSEIDRFYVVLDTRDSGPFTRSVRHGDEFDVEFGYESPDDARHRFVDVPLGVRPPAYSIDPDLVDDNENTEHYPYYRTSETGDTDVKPFRIEDPSADYDRTTVDDELLVHNGTEVTIEGTTNVAPGTETHIQLIAHNRTNPTRITIDEVEIDEDGSFSATDDLSALRVGEDVEAEFYANQRLADKRAADVVEDLEDPSAFVVTDVGNRTITEGENSSQVSATVENTGNAADRKPVQFFFEGDRLEEVPRTVEPDEPAPFNFDIPAGLEAGTYNYTVVTPDDEAAGQLTVEPPEPDEVLVEGGEPPGDDPEAPVDDSLPDDALGELIGSLTSLVGARHAIGAAVVVGGAYVLGG